MRGRKVTSSSGGIAFDIKLLHMAVLIVITLMFLVLQCVLQGSLICGGGAVLLSVICVPFVTPALRKICLPYVPATTTQVENVIKALHLQGRRTGSLIDLGSGDGRIVLAAAKQGFQATGVELNPWLVLYSKFQALTNGLSSSATFQRKDIWKTDLSLYDNVVIFGVDSMMKDLEQKCKAEMKTDSMIAACRFSFPNRVPNRVVGEGLDTVWVYDNNSNPDKADADNPLTPSNNNLKGVVPPEKTSR